MESRLTREKYDVLFWWGSWHYIGRYIVPVVACIGQCSTHAPRDRRRVVGALVILGLRCVPGFCFLDAGRGLLGIVYGRSIGRDTFRAVVIGDIFLIDFFLAL